MKTYDDYGVAGEDILLGFAANLKQTEAGPKRDALWCDFSQRMFTLLPSTRPYVFRDFSDAADHVSALNSPELSFDNVASKSTNSSERTAGSSCIGDSQRYKRGFTSHR